MEKWAIQSILVSNKLPLEEAKQHAKNIAKTDRFHKLADRSKNFYRFRIVHPSYFDIYRTRKVNKDIRIVFGRLKHKYGDLEGAGFFSDLVATSRSLYKKTKSKIQNVFSPSSAFNNISNKTLGQFGNQVISEMKVVRTPIQKIISSALNLITLGKFDELKKKYGYDKLFHLSLMCNVGNKLVYVEKNEVVNISPNFTITDQSEFRDVSLGNRTITLNDLVMNTLNSIGNQRFFQYDAFTTNCQRFIIDILTTNKLITDELQAFILQPMEQIVAELPSGLPKFARTITDVGAILSRLRGDGRDVKKEFKKYLKTRKVQYPIDYSELNKYLVDYALHL
jgi:hypothetical protein